MSKQQMPIPTPEQIKQIEIVFLKNFGLSPRKIRKDILAFMVVNQSSNVQKVNWDANQIVGIGLAMKRQRDYYLKLIRTKKEELEDERAHTEIMVENLTNGYEQEV